MFELQNMTYEDFLTGNTNYRNANLEDYHDAMHINSKEYQGIAFDGGAAIMYIAETMQDDVGKFTVFIDCEVKI